MKKFISILLVCLMVFSLAGCSSDSGDSDKDTTKDQDTNNQSPDNADADADADADKDGEIYNMVMEVINYGYDDKDIQIVEDAVNKITESQIGVHVSFLTVPIMNMATKLELMVAGEEQMDLVQTGLLTTPNNLAAKGLLTPMTEYIEKSETLKGLAGDLLKASTVDGEIYAYPMNLYPGISQQYLYDTDLAAEYNIDMPERIASKEDWEHIFQQVVDSGMPQYAISLGDGVNQEYSFGYDFDGLGEQNYCSYGVIMDIENGTTIQNWYATDEYKQQSAMKREWYEKGYVVPDSISNGYTTSDSMKQGAIFGYACPVGTGSSVSYWSSTTGKNLAGIPVTDVSIKGSNVVNASWGIASNCERPDKVVEFLELLYTDSELANLLQYGIEGTHYVTQEGSKIILYPEGVDGTSVGYGSFIANYGDTRELYQRQPLTDEFIANIDDFGLVGAKVSNFMDYTFDTSPVATELANVNAVIAQYSPSIAVGIVDPDETIPEFLDALENAGIDKVIAENQKQLDAYLAAK